DQLCGAMREEARIDVHRLDRLEMGVLGEFSENPQRLRLTWWRWRLWPWHAYRHQLLGRWFPAWCVRPTQYAGFRSIGPLGWLPFPAKDLSPQSRRELTAHARWEYGDVFKTFRITIEPDRAL